jgi:acetolactate synthase-1/2/3 large subunit
MKGASLFVKTLEDMGVEYVFGVPGDIELSLFEELSSSGIEFFTTRHEQTGAFMADVYGRLIGKPGVCFSTLGPGATNLMTGVANAYLDRSPVIAISGQLKTGEFHKDSHQYIDLETIFRPVTKQSMTIQSVKELYPKLCESFEIAETERPGPVHITLPIDVLDEEISDYQSYSKHETPAQAYDLDKVYEAIKNSTFPIIIAGNAIIRQNASKELVNFMDKYHILAFSTFQGKCAIPDNHPLYLGVISRHLKSVQRNFELADLVLNFGYDLVEGIKPSLWGNGVSKRVISFDTVPNTAEVFYKPDIEVVCNLKQCLKELCENYECTPKSYISKDPFESPEIVSEDANYRFPLRPPEVIREIRNVLGTHDIIVSDVGMHKQFVGLLFRAYHPKTVLFSNGLSSMGFSLPAAMAAKLVNPDRNVLAVCGDGGFMMNVQDLETAVRYDLPITIVIMNDSAYGLVKYAQIKKFGETYGAEFQNPDFKKLAESFGARGFNVESASDLGNILRAAVHSGKVSVVNVPIDYSEGLSVVGKGQHERR